MQDQPKEPDRSKFFPKKFSGQVPQKTSQVFDAEQAFNSSSLGKDHGEQCTSDLMLQIYLSKT